MKMRNKGKVHPSPSSSSSSSSSPSTTKDVLSILKLLPATILTLASVLSLQDKEVLAYMITRSLMTTINPLNILEEKSKKTSTPNSRNNRNNVSHRPPMFDCECFDCYTSYWSKWNSSPSRELIHQAIEAFEEHLSTNNVEGSSSLGKNNKGRNKKKERMGRRGVENVQESVFQNQESSQEIVALENGSTEKLEVEKGSLGNADVEAEEMVVEAAQSVLTAARGSGSSHKGLARKVLPDVLGLFNSRLWSLWGPNV